MKQLAGISCVLQHLVGLFRKTVRPISFFTFSFSAFWAPNSLKKGAKTHTPENITHWKRSCSDSDRSMCCVWVCFLAPAKRCATSLRSKIASERYFFLWLPCFIPFSLQISEVQCLALGPFCGSYIAHFFLCEELSGTWYCQWVHRDLRARADQCLVPRP